MSWSSESTDSSHRCCNENTHKISSPGHSQWYGSKCCSAEFEESYSEYATLFWLIFPVSLQEHWFWSKSSHFFFLFFNLLQCHFILRQQSRPRLIVAKSIFKNKGAKSPHGSKVHLPTFGKWWWELFSE